MVESSRLFLWTEYARKGCGTINTHGTDYKVWEALPVRFTIPQKLHNSLTAKRTDFQQTRKPKSFSLAARKT